MMENDAWQELQRQWKAYLSTRGHEVGSPGGVTCAMESRDGAGKRYRWLLLVAQRKSRSLDAAEREDIQRHVRRAKGRSEEAYIVLRFEKPQPKVIVIPAESALRAKRIFPEKGGIPWVG